ncbi:MAG TPA: hypothetical protein VGQ61_05630 [Candidatus Angelobacter sp.]|jgi:hypothetical protein|nr:hypothetical protein [Candidatus Angelobacter sp.]
MKMKAKLFLSAAAMVAFMASPVFAQHGHGGGMGSSASMHGSDHSSSTHGSSGDHSGQGSTQSSVSTRLSSNTKLASKLQGLLPPGTDLQTAASGFKNLGQFVAAVHVSHNLGIPFDQLKAKMQGPPTESLGKAIHELKPDVDAKAQTKTAESEAHQDMDNDSTK